EVGELRPLVVGGPDGYADVDRLHDVGDLEVLAFAGALAAPAQQASARPLGCRQAGAQGGSPAGLAFGELAGAGYGRCEPGSTAIRDVILEPAHRSFDLVS